MHSLSLVSGIIEEIDKQTKAHNLSRVNRVKLGVGKEGDTEEEIAFLFKSLAKNSPLEGVELVIESVEGKGVAIEIEGE